METRAVGPGQVMDREERIASLMTSGCVELSEVHEFVEAFGLDDTDVQRLFDEIESRGYELSDDCGRDVPEQVTYANDDLAVVTTDALQLFLTDLRRYPLLTAAQEVDLAKRIER